MTMPLSRTAGFAHRPRSLRRPAAVTPLHTMLIGSGSASAASALVLFYALRCLGLLTLSTMTLLPAAACAGGAAVSLGVLMVCLRELRRA